MLHGTLGGGFFFFLTRVKVNKTIIITERGKQIGAAGGSLQD